MICGFERGVLGWVRVYQHFLRGCMCVGLLAFGCDEWKMQQCLQCRFR